MLKTVAPAEVLGVSTNTLLGRQDDTRSLYGLARALGYRLVRPDLRALRELRADLAAFRDCEEARANPFLRGVVGALTEVAAAFDAESERLQAGRKVADAARARPLHASILAALEGDPRRPTDLSGLLEREPAQISRALGDLRSTGWVTELERKPTQDQRERWYVLTPEGLRVVGSLSAASAQQVRVGEPAASQGASPAEPGRSRRGIVRFERLPGLEFDCDVVEPLDTEMYEVSTAPSREAATKRLTPAIRDSLATPEPVRLRAGTRAAATR